MVFRLFTKIQFSVFNYNFGEKTVEASQIINLILKNTMPVTLNFIQNLKKLMVYKYHILKNRLSVPVYLEAVTNSRVIGICRNIDFLRKEMLANSPSSDANGNIVPRESDFTKPD